MPTPEPLLLGLDIGTSRIKALLVDRAGGEVRVEARATPFVTRSEGVEMTVGLLDEATASVVRAMGDLRGRVVGVGIAGMAESGAPLGAADEALGPVLAWHDPRGSDVVARLVDRFGDELAGWIGQPVRTVSSVAKLGWLVDHGVTGVTNWAGVPELCLRRLTGVQVTEYSLAARTGWYHVRERRYLPEVARAIGPRLGPEVFLPVEPAGRAMGRLSADGATWSGLPVGIPVTLAGHDHLVGMVGSGAGPDDAVNSVGTAESVLR
ncbi:MAG: FGGY family carbohydrate kinase, partial [Actinomycetota bacterium]|nr:FGGY family carbohydrate kinase [Actinomycetota bacterium]